MQHALAVVPDIPTRPVALPGTLGTLHGDDVGAEVGKRLHRHRAKQEMVEADDANALQQVEHAPFSFPCRWRSFDPSTRTRYGPRFRRCCLAARMAPA